ncbi:putative arginine--tRNA ligase, mitochondrial [Tachypleus tridentatus]|uniref:putative arginine--tRNA ligase, mitochondrial n=1 Tax=Tachypleus tridentatus TaxID=6853 RepID=UPI003FD362EA
MVQYLTTRKIWACAGHEFQKRRDGFLGDILNEAKYRALEKIQASPTTKVTKEVEEVADILGVSAVLINDLKSRRRNDYTFKWERAVQDKGDCGIVLQYSHARLANLQRNCGVTLDVDCDLSALVEPEALYLVQHLAKFDEVIFEAYESLEPCVLVQYLFSLCHLAGRANKVLVVKNQDMTVAQARLLLFHCAKNVLNCGMKILSLKPLERM